jgi:GlcNAc-P-P-Und epimerase
VGEGGWTTITDERGSGGRSGDTAVVGGAGFVGRALVRALGRARVVDRNVARDGAGARRADVRDGEALLRALEGVHTVYLLAAEHADNVEPRSLYFDVNVGGAENVVRAARAHGIQRIVFTSTVAIYGLDAPSASESVPPAPFNDYGRSKWEAERRLMEWAEEDPARSLLIIRPSVVFGEGNRGNVFNLLQQLASGRFLLVGSGRNRKSMAYVENLVAFMKGAAERMTGIQVFNYADKPDLEMGELVRIAADELGVRPPRIGVPYPAGLAAGLGFDLLASLTGRTFPVSAVRIRKFCADTTIDTSRARATGFSPPFTLEEGLRRMIRSEFPRGAPP